VRSICCLAGALGAYEKLGGGVLYDSGCEFKPNLDAVKRPDWLERPTRSLNMTDIGIALTEWRDPPIDLLYVHGTNPAATAPLQNRVIEGPAREDLFTIVHGYSPTRRDTPTWCCPR
jgi:anaerobic selenocysteine-containing dehydrogenase